MRHFKFILALLISFAAIVTSGYAATNRVVWDSLPEWKHSLEEPESRAQRLQTVDQAVKNAVRRATCDFGKDQSCTPVWSPKYDPNELRWMLIGQAYFETHLAEHIHEDKCRKEGEPWPDGTPATFNECDNGKAKSLWQIQQSSNVYPPHIWKTIGGKDLESTERAAWGAAVVLSRTYNRCRSIQGAISLYATGKSCYWKKASKRAAWIREKRKHYRPGY